MSQKEKFCNSPWFELHIYWDGSLAYCCAQTPYKPYDEKLKSQYNIKNTTIKEFYNSRPMRNARLDFSNTIKDSKCLHCWKVEKYGITSRRYRQNQKSVIFQVENFDESYQQSPHNKIFEHSFKHDGDYEGLPIDLHIDLGNHCNLACKMCCAEASSKIASQENKWGILKDKNTLNNNWTLDDTVWNRFMNEILSIPNLKNIHFMGGETLLSPRLKELVDRFIENKKFDVCFSYVTNGTFYDQDLMDKLSNFARVGIEVSIESCEKQNEYIRQGCKNENVLSNIAKFKKLTNNKTSVTLRPTLGALNIGSYASLIEFAVENGFIIKSDMLIHPPYLTTDTISLSTRKQYLNSYLKVKEKLNLDDTLLEKDVNDSYNYKAVALKEINKCIQEVQLPNNEDQDKLQKQLVKHLKRWDQVYGFDAYEYYPEFDNMLKKYEY